MPNNKAVSLLRGPCEGVRWGTQRRIPFCTDADTVSIDTLPDQWRDGGPGAQLAALVADPSAIESMPREQLVQLLSQLDGLHATVLVRLISPVPPPVVAAVDDDQLLTVVEVAAKLAVDERWVYEHTDTDLKSCTRRIGSRTVRFSRNALERWLQTR